MPVRLARGSDLGVVQIEQQQQWLGQRLGERLELGQRLGERLGQQPEQLIHTFC